MQIKLVQAKSILNKSKLAGDGYTLNPYLGCTHSCVYCYNQQFMKRLRPNQLWGRFLEVKINAPEILAKEVKKMPKKPVFLSTVTDAYNYYERKYQITRQCLEILLHPSPFSDSARPSPFDNNTSYFLNTSSKGEGKNASLKGEGWPINILTKSDLILRDLDLLKQFKTKEVGFTLTTLDPKAAKVLESGASSPEQRIEALKNLHQAGISTYAFIAPILPYLTDLPAIFQVLQGLVDEIWLDSFNTSLANWQGLKEVFKKNWPDLVQQYETIFFKNRKQYLEQLRQQARVLSEKYQIPVQVYF